MWWLLFLLAIVLIIVVAALIIRNRDEPRLASYYYLSQDLETVLPQFDTDYVTHYEETQLLNTNQAMLLDIGISAKYSQVTTFKIKPFLYYNKNTFPSGFNVTSADLISWLNLDPASPYTISYGAVRGASKQALANLSGIPLETLVTSFGEIGDYSRYSSFGEWFMANNVDLAFAPYDTLADSNIGIATIDDLLPSDAGYPLFTPYLNIVTNSSTLSNNFDTIQKGLNQLIIDKPQLYSN